MARLPTVTFVLSCFFALGCGGGDDGGGQDADAGPGTGGPDASVGDNLGEVPEATAHSGVVYLAHYWSEDLQRYRVDGEVPVSLPPFDLGAVTHDLVIDPVNNLLVAVHDVEKRVAIYQLDRPASPEAAVADPVFLSNLTPSTSPVFAEVHPYLQQVYVVTSPPLPPEGPITEMLFHIYDLSNPSQPVEMSGSPFSIPPTTSFAVDAARSVLFVVANVEDKLYAYDLTKDGLRALDGDPIDLTSMYPEDNQFAFQARNLTVDPHRNRLLAARSQSALSELIALEYPADVPRGGARYGQFATMSDIRVLPDALNVEVPPGDRQNLLDAYKVSVDPVDGAVFMTANAWNGTTSTALTAAFSPDLSELAVGCDDFEGFGCFHRSYSEGSPGSFLRTDGAMCLDFTHKVVVGTTIATDERDPGTVTFFRYGEGLAMEPWLGAGGSSMMAGSLPIGAVCH